MANMELEFSKVRNLIFDLGGVIINIDFDRTYNALARLADLSYEETLSFVKKEDLFYRFETGRLDEKGFFSLVRSSLCPGRDEEDVRQAWNALLMDIPRERIELLTRLRKKYRLYLLSNTNFTHILEVNNILSRNCGVPDLKDLFDKVYYSYEIDMVKPDVGIYRHVCEDSRLNPEETVFLDDMPPNLEGASHAGLLTLHVQPSPNSIIELLRNA